MNHTNMLHTKRLSVEHLKTNKDVLLAFLFTHCGGDSSTLCTYIEAMAVM